MKQAYRAADLDLGADLAKLAAAWLLDHTGTPTGRGHQPIVTLHPIGDGVAPEHERTWGDRVETGRRPSTSPERPNAEASRFGPEFHFLYDWLHGEPGTAAPAFRRHHPAPLPRVA